MDFRPTWAKGSVILFLVILALVLPEQINCNVSFDDDVTLSKSQVAALQEFKARVLPQLTVDYMKEDIYLAKWLRARKFDVDKSESALQKHLAWRKETNFDNFKPDEFADIEKDYPMEVVGQDRDGKPLLQWPLDEWDIRSAALAGKMERLVTYTSKKFNDAWLKVVELQNDGKNVTRFQTLITVAKINVPMHINPSSFPYYIGGTLSYDRNFPKMGDNIIVVDTPQIFQIVVNLAKSVMDEDTRNSVKAFGTNRKEWMNELEDKFDIDRSQLTAAFGGTKQSKLGF